MLSVIMLYVTYKPFMLSVVLLNVVMLSVVVPMIEVLLTNTRPDCDNISLLHTQQLIS
jgi:hypothetical protein